MSEQPCTTSLQDGICDTENGNQHRAAVQLVAQPSWKRPLDVLLATLGLVALSPIGLFVALMVRLKLGRPVLFRQQRGGLCGSEFQILKFRTMTNESGPDGQLLSNDDRRHPFGEALRRSSLDELPALLNVIRGEMSIVGPRPLMAVYLERYSQIQAQRHGVRPGITGLAQVTGRNSVSWDEKFALDLNYIANLGLRNDLRILAQTVLAVFRPHEADGNELTTEFR